MANELALAEAIVAIRADVTALNSQIASMKARTQSSLEQFGGKLKTIATGIAASFGAVAGFGALAAGIRSAISFQDKMVKSTAIMGDVTNEQRAQMESLARQMSTKFGRSASDVAEAYFFLASAGLNVEQQMASLPAVMEFAQAGAFDLATATDLLTDAQSALGMSSQDAQQNLANMTALSNVLVKANTLANASVSQFSEALTNKAAGALRVTNKSMEEGVAVLATFADRGVKGAEAGEKLNIILRDIPRAAAKNEKQFAKFGVRVLDQNKNMLSLAEIVDNLGDKLASMSDAEAAAMLDTLGLTRGVGDAVKQLAGAGDQIRRYQSALEDAGGTTAEVARKQMQSLTVQLQIMRARLVDAFIETLPVVTPIVRGLGNAISIVGEMIKQTVSTIVAFNAATGGFVGNFVKATAAVFGFVLIAPKVVAAVRIIGAAIKTQLIGSGIGLIAVAVGSAIAALLTMRDHLMGLKPVQEAIAAGQRALSNIFEELKPVVDTFFGFMNAWLETMGANFRMTTTDWVGSISAFVTTAIQWVQEFVLDTFEWLKVLTTRWQTVWGIIQLSVGVTFSQMKDIVFNFLDNWKDFLVAFVRIATSHLQVLADVFRAALAGENIWEAFQDSVSKQVELAKSTMNKLFEPSAGTKALQREMGEQIDELFAAKDRLERERNIRIAERDAAAALARPEAATVEATREEAADEAMAIGNAIADAIKPGFTGLTEANRAIQEQQFKKEDKQVGLLSDIRDASRATVTELKKEKPAPLAVAAPG